MTAERRQRPEGIGDVQQRGTALSQGLSESWGDEHNTRMVFQIFKKKLFEFSGMIGSSFKWDVSMEQAHLHSARCDWC